MILDVAALAVLILSSVPLGAETPPPPLVASIGAALQQGDLASASATVAQYRKQNGDTPEALDGLSWIARAELAAGNFEAARKHAEEVQRASQAALGTRKLDAEPYLPIALGAAYEVQVGVLSQQNKRAEAVQMLQAALRMWRGTSVEERLQKNLNLLILEGRTLPSLRETEWLGSKPAPSAALRGKVILIFFWAHWCADCKAEAPVIASLEQEFGQKDFAVVAPTKRYGYTASEEHAAPEAELAFIRKVYDRFYSDIPNAGIPLDGVNFEKFGVSTTPTLVLVDRHGVVRLYHPGLMSAEDLRAAIAPLIKDQSVARASR